MGSCVVLGLTLQGVQGRHRHVAIWESGQGGALLGRRPGRSLAPSARVVPGRHPVHISGHRARTTSGRGGMLLRGPCVDPGRCFVEGASAKGVRRNRVKNVEGPNARVVDRERRVRITPAHHTAASPIENKGLNTTSLRHRRLRSHELYGQGLCDRGGRRLSGRCFGVWTTLTEGGHATPAGCLFLSTQLFGEFVFGSGHTRSIQEIVVCAIVGVGMMHAMRTPVCIHDDWK